MSLSSAVGSRLVAALKRFFIAGAAAGLPAGTLARDYLISHGGPAERMFILPNTCPIDRFARESAQARSRRAALREEWGLGSGPVALSVGRLTPVKGLDTLLRAFAHSGDQAIRRSGVQGDRPEHLNARTPDRLNALPSLLLVGEGEQRGELEALAAALGVGDRVRFAGSRPWEELPSLYAVADLFVLPSTFEPWGAVVAEALACGLPVVVSDRVGCAPDLVRPGENGWVVPAGDVGALAAVLGEALADPARLAVMGAASARMARDWGEDACLDAFAAAVEAASSLRTQASDARQPPSGYSQTSAWPTSETESL
jgi:glycosyltransferase involved in cell wall biosynthesis